MMRSPLKCFFVLILPFLFLFLSLPVFAWNALGHMVISNIAYQNLNPKAKNKVDKLVVTFSKEYPELHSLLLMSSWPDAIRSQRIDAFNRWHYIDVPFSHDKTPLKNTISSDNAVWVVSSMKQVLLNPHANVYEQARFLAFMVHIVGDLHQPLHTVTRLTAAYPNGDKGGNLFKVRFNGKKINLHKLWDDGIGILSDDATLSNANRLSNAITTLYPLRHFGNRAQDLSLGSWEKEGMQNATTHVYNTPEGMDVSTAYVAKSKEVVQEELALAGYRLAALLNQLLG